MALHLIALVDMKQFDNVKKLCTYAGVVPLNCVSGTSVRRAARVAPHCQRVLRTELLRAGVSTMSGKTKDPLIRHNLDKFRNGERQLSGFALAMAMGHKLLRVCYGVHKSGKLYRPIVG